MAESNPAVYPFLARGLLHVLEDRLAVSDGLPAGPRLEGIAQRENVGIGTHARVAEQVPGTADARAALENGEGLAGAVHQQMVGRRDSRQPGAYHQNVQVLDDARLLNH